MDSVGPFTGFLIVAMLMLLPGAGAYLLYRVIRDPVRAKTGQWATRVLAVLSISFYLVIGTVLLRAVDSTGVLGKQWIGD